MLSKLINENPQVFLEAKQFSNACFSGKRWGGNAILILLDTALTSSGLKYFTVVVPRVKTFENKFLEKHGSLEKASKIKCDNPELLALFNNKRVWNVFCETAKALLETKREMNFENDFDALKHWAENADETNWSNDAVGKINGIGLNSFQYLRMQAGIDTLMPDKIILRFMEKELKVTFSNQPEAIEKFDFLRNKYGMDAVTFCWFVWLLVSDKPRKNR
ncbi:MAG: hypothetical protein J7K00_03450 [Candidatus Diapherotrites archaeon]|nr:hypothetical protein [Candidatus Diapherotrites archaeon]